MLADMKVATARLSISYVDLVVARSFEASVVNWYNSLPRLEESALQRIVRTCAPASDFFTRMLMIFTAVFICYSLFSAQISNSSSLFLFGLLSTAVIMTSNIAGFKVAEIISRLLRSFAPLSLVFLSEADDTAGRRQVTKSSKWILVAGFSWIGIVATGILINYLSKALL